MIRFTVQGRLPGLNEYIDACRRNKYQAAKMKREAEDLIALFAKRIPAVKGPVQMSFVWHERSRKRDPDNVAFAKKFVLDALVKLKKLPNDNATFIRGLRDQFAYGGSEGVAVLILEDEDE